MSILRLNEVRCSPHVTCFFDSLPGLLSVALHPDFPTNPGVYVYWTMSNTTNDTNDLANVPLLGNRVDRFVWDGTRLTFDSNLIRLRAFQADAGQPLRGNHNGGPIRFGPDGYVLVWNVVLISFFSKLYIIIGDNGRRGQLQNLINGPTGVPGQPDDQFGGPEVRHLFFFFVPHFFFACCVMITITYDCYSLTPLILLE